MVGSEVLGWQGCGRTDLCTWGSPFFSVRARGRSRFGGNELAADGYARVRRGGGRADPVLVEVGMGSLCGGADERWSFAWGELVGRLTVFFSVWCG